MQGAKEYNKMLRQAALHNSAGFKFEQYNKFRNGNFVFILGKHAMGETLNVYLMKDFNPKLFRYFSSYYLKPKNALHIYGPVEGRLEYNEKYDFLVEGIIKEKLEKLFSDTEKVWNNAERNRVREEKDEKNRKKLEKERRIKEFEKIFEE